jgi:hypothetical protein
LFLVDPNEVVDGQPIGQRDSGLLDGARQIGEVFGRPFGQTCQATSQKGPLAT